MDAVPRDVKVCLAAWVAVSALVLAVASVPAFSPPWQTPTTPDHFAVIQYWWPWLFGMVAAVSGALLLPSTRTTQITCVAWCREMLRAHRGVLWLMLAAALLRFMLVRRGGQYFDWDEVRYGGSATWMFAYVSTGHFREALDMLLRAPDHPAFRIAGLPLAFFHVASAWPTALPITEMRYPTGEWLPAFLLSLSSVCSIGLTYALALRAGACRRESFLAAFLMFASSSMLIYAQHFFPYDTALAMLLFALWIAMKDGRHLWRSLAAGLLCGFAFLTYEGYWLMAAVVGGLHVLRNPRRPSLMILRAGLFSAGTALFPALLIAAGQAAGRPFAQALERFSRSAVNGDFSEGWSLPWAYLWHAEHLLLLVYVLGMVAAAVQYVREKRDDHSLVWLSAAAAIYLGLIAGSNLFHRWVVYDRLVRQMLPFVCLAAAAGIAHVGNGRLMRGTPALALYAVIAVVFTANAAPLMAQRYPREIARDAIQKYGAANVRLATIVAHSDEATVQVFLPVQADSAESPAAARRYVLLNAQDIWVPDGTLEAVSPPAGKVLFSVRHPRQLPVMQYHGYRPEERAFVRSIDLSMELIDTKSAH